MHIGDYMCLYICTYESRNYNNAALKIYNNNILINKKINLN